jgi:hypothetical protein
MADFEINVEFIARAKKAQTLLLQGINLHGQAASYPLPLADFAKANEGPATDPQKLKEQQDKMQKELQRRGEERLRQQKSSGAPAASR